MLIYDEVDLGPPGQFIHRILFWSNPLREIEIGFRGLKISTEPRPDRELGTTKGLYTEQALDPA
jgi:hypothetical protein